jgi:hypothetical protein
MSLQNFTTLVEAERMLRKNGFTANFRFADGKLKDADTGKTYLQNQLTILSRHRFEGATNPADMSILFAIQAEDGTKGQLVSAFGTYANTDLLEFLDGVKVADRTEVAGP